MLSITNEKKKIFKGAGVLIGFAIALVPIVLIIALTGDASIAVPVGVAFGIPIGVNFEKKFQTSSVEIKSQQQRVIIIVIALINILFALWYLVSV